MKKTRILMSLILLGGLTFFSQKSVQATGDYTVKDSINIINQVETEQKEKTIKLNDTGIIVKSIQNVLNTKFNYVLVEDGNYGVNTALAIVDFQKNNKLPITGIVDKETALRLIAPAEDNVIKSAQHYLNILCNFDLEETGYMDELTIKAVTAFQIERIIPITGKIDEGTINEIVTALKEKGLIK